MRKETGKIIIEGYDDHAHKVTETEVESYIIAKELADKWENKTPGNNAVIYRVLYNTKSKGDKF